MLYIMKKLFLLLVLVSTASFAQDGFNVDLGIDMKPNSLMAGVNYGWTIPETRVIISGGYQATFKDFTYGDVYIDGKYKLDDRWAVGGGLASYVRDLGTLHPMASITYRVGKRSTRAFLNYTKYAASIGGRIPIRIQIARR